MRIGIDLDNTLICYDALFHELAFERGLIDASVAARKTAVRDHLRARGKEEAWTELQGLAYGPYLPAALPFPGALEFCRVCRERGIELRIISHKTRYPARGPRFDLHGAALAWLRAYRLIDDARTDLTRAEVFLEPTRRTKLECIARERCTHFIDDLPEFLISSGFPGDVARILFDPHDSTPDAAEYERFPSFCALMELLKVAA